MNTTSQESFEIDIEGIDPIEEETVAAPDDGTGVPPDPTKPPNP